MAKVSEVAPIDGIPPPSKAGRRGGPVFNNYLQWFNVPIGHAAFFLTPNRFLIIACEIGNFRLIGGLLAANSLRRQKIAGSLAGKLT